MSYVPSLAVVLSTIVGLACSLPVPLLIASLFAKTPVNEVRTVCEKQVIRWIWRLKQALGWLITIGLNSLCVLQLSQYSSEYELLIFHQFAGGMAQALTHKFVTVPVGRGLVFACIVVLSKCVPLCDPCILFCPQIVPVERPRGEIREDTEGGGDGADAGGEAGAADFIDV